MKSKTYKLLVGALILLQLIAITAVVFTAAGGGAQPGTEDRRLNELVTDVLKAGVIVNEYQMSFATGQRISDAEEYEQQKSKLFASLDGLEKLSQGNPERLAIYQEQRKLVTVGDNVVQKLKALMENPEGSGSKMSRMLVMFAGLRKLSSVSHKLTDNFTTLSQTSPNKTDSLPVLPITAAAACAVSLLLAGFLMTKAPVD